MPKHKVVSIEQSPSGPDRSELLAEDETQVGGVRKSRFILGIGTQRIAFDFTSRVTELKPGTGDAPAPVVPLKNGSKRKTKRQRS
jgi:hypothetical protein